jgi:hypothetical protein
MQFRWFVGLSMEVRIWDVSVFTKNPHRLLDGDIACCGVGQSAGQASAVIPALLLPKRIAVTAAADK